MKTKTRENIKRNSKNSLIFLFGFIFILLFSISFITATSIEGIKQGEEQRIYQTCNNCTYCNFTKVMNQENSTLFSNIQATQDGSYFYFDIGGGNTTTLGTYTYCYDCGNNAERKTGCIDFKVTPSGQSGTENIIFFLFLIIMIYLITFLGFFGRNIPMTILGGMAMMFLGVYLINQGVIIYRDDLTNYFSYLTIAVGMMTSFWAILEQLDIF